MLIYGQTRCDDVTCESNFTPSHISLILAPFWPTWDRFQECALLLCRALSVFEKHIHSHQVAGLKLGATLGTLGVMDPCFHLRLKLWTLWALWSAGTICQTGYFHCYCSCCWIYCLRFNRFICLQNRDFCKNTFKVFYLEELWNLLWTCKGRK